MTQNEAGRVRQPVFLRTLKSILVYNLLLDLDIVFLAEVLQ